MGSVSASSKKVICRRVCFKQLAKFQVKKKRFDRPTRLLPGLVGSFINVHMYDEFHVPDVLTVLLKTKLSGVLIQTKAIL